MTRYRSSLTFLLAAFVVSLTFRSGSAAEPEREYLLERVDDVAVVQVYCDGFDELPLDEKILIYHLTEAAIAGRDIFLHQKYRHSPMIRDLLEEIVTNSDGIDEDTLAEIRRYTKLFWVNNGIHNTVTSKKNVIGASKEDFLKAALQAEKNGAKLPKREGLATEEFIAKIWPLLADPKVDSHCTNSAPGEGKDILEESCNSFYRGVTVADLEGFEERYPLNSTLVKRDGKLRELVWRGGFDDVIPPGLYAKQITQWLATWKTRFPTQRRRWLGRWHCWLTTTGRVTRSTSGRTTSPGWKTRTRPSTRSTVSSRSILTHGGRRGRTRELSTSMTR